MAQETDNDDTAQEITTDAQDPKDTASNVPADGSVNAEHDDAPTAGMTAAPASESPAPPAAPVAPEASTTTTPAATLPGNLAELSAQLRQEAAEITEIAAQAGRLGIAIDAAKALREGTTPEALRSLVLQRASAAADARDIVAAPPSPVLPQATESPLIAAAKRDAAAGKRT